MEVAHVGALACMQVARVAAYELAQAAGGEHMGPKRAGFGIPAGFLPDGNGHLQALAHTPRASR